MPQKQIIFSKKRRKLSAKCIYPGQHAQSAQADLSRNYLPLINFLYVKRLGYFIISVAKCTLLVHNKTIFFFFFVTMHYVGAFCPLFTVHGKNMVKIYICIENIYARMLSLLLDQSSSHALAVEITSWVRVHNHSQGTFFDVFF